MKFYKFWSPPDARELAPTKPAKAFIPEWYKKAESFFTDFDGSSQPGLKTCMPYLDALAAGYIVSTPVDIYVNEHQNDLAHLFNSEELMIRWDGPQSLFNFIQERPMDSGYTMPRPPGHFPNHLIFSGYTAMKTPRGWSTLMTTPLNRDDLPWTTASGIIDTDKFYSAGNIPFFLKKGITGLIPKGTPMVQLIPIKRASWTMLDNDPSIKADSDIVGSFVTNPENKAGYKKKFWQRKEYS